MTALLLPERKLLRPTYDFRSPKLRALFPAPAIVKGTGRNNAAVGAGPRSVNAISLYSYVIGGHDVNTCTIPALPGGATASQYLNIGFGYSENSPGINMPGSINWTHFQDEVQGASFGEFEFAYKLASVTNGMTFGTWTNSQKVGCITLHNPNGWIATPLVNYDWYTNGGTTMSYEVWTATPAATSFCFRWAGFRGSVTGTKAPNSMTVIWDQDDYATHLRQTCMWYITGVTSMPVDTDVATGSGAKMLMQFEVKFA